MNVGVHVAKLLYARAKTRKKETDVYQSVDALGTQLESGKLEVERARSMVVGWKEKSVVLSFFDHLSKGRVSDAFALVVDNVKWWGPGNVLLNVGRPCMMLRMEDTARRGTSFEVTEMVAGKDAVAAKVSILFLFLFIKFDLKRCALSRS